MSAPRKHPLSQILSLTVLVASLGYFVDMFDLLLFPIVRQPSLTDLGIPQGDAQVSATFLLLNSQMVGMLLGGIFWGVLGDKKGRLSTLFGSIALYSLANIANAFVHGTPSYAAWRFLAGLGLAGELGAAVTLVSEILPRNLRAYGTAIVAGVGIFGTVTASLVGKYFAWRTAYLVGGGLGLVLLATRFSLRESAMFRDLGHQAGVTRGDFLSLFTRRPSLKPVSLNAIRGVILLARQETVGQNPRTSPQSGGSIAAGPHTISLVALAGATTDCNDIFNVTVTELPY